MSFNLFIYSKELGEFILKSEDNNIQESDLIGFCYYFDFKLLLCSECHIAINKDYLKAHLLKHLISYKGKTKELKAIEVINFFNKLEINSFSNSLVLISSFIKIYPSFYFKELLIDSYYKCNFCFKLFKSFQNFKRHIISDHINIDLKELESYFLLIKGQKLGSNNGFFEINLKEKLSLNNNSNSLEELSILEQAKQAFLANFSKKEDLFLNKLNNIKINSKEKLTPFQTKTRYLEYINKHNIKDLVDLIKPLDKNEKILKVLVLNLEEMLYLSLEKSIFLNRYHLNLLNSFEAGKVRNKGLKPLLNSSTRIAYFKFFN
jgi:hypothetical protein